MKAVVYKQSLEIAHPDSLIDAELPTPEANGRDLLIKVEAIAVNPVDYKVRQGVDPKGTNKILGWDAVGTVVAVGDAVEHYQVGDEVYYAGDITRPGSYSEYQLVDERIAGKKPQNLSNAEAAALPLTAITAWELLFDRFKLAADTQKQPTLLVMGAAGGVGSILVQLAKQLTNAKVIATASRQESVDWVKQLGADAVINHHQPLLPQLVQLGIGQVSHVACLTHLDQHFPQLVEVLQPQGMLGAIEGSDINIFALKDKSISFHWEFMFTRAMFQTEDMAKQKQLLDEVSNLVDQGKIKSTIGQNLGLINAPNLKKAHAILEQHSAVGKIVLEGF